MDSLADLAAYGIIPALAGNTGHDWGRSNNWSDHPRSRGEYSLFILNSKFQFGSSPLSRGIHNTPSKLLVVPGIIPALAGNTIDITFPHVENEDHPRSRGEYWRPLFTGVLGKGSSPLSRGILVVDLDLDAGEGIIPALAGNTEERIQRARHAEDHPRSRGEYAFAAPARKSQTGSSPLSRGIRCSGYRRGWLRRIIPALAGNTTFPSCMNPSRKDHPRSRGEYRVETTTSHADNGSSPLSRGIRLMGTRDAHTSRIIPALAGNTPTSLRPVKSLRDHPRSRGEY